MFFCGFVLQSCYSKKISTETSSVRSLNSPHETSILYEPSGIRDDKKALITVYTFDHRFAYNHFWFYENILHDRTTFKPKNAFGIRGEYFIADSPQPFRLFGIGLNYSQNQFTTQATVLLSGKELTQVQFVRENRLHASFNYITLTRDYITGFINFEPGYQTHQRKVSYDQVFGETIIKGRPRFNFRVAYGLNLYLIRNLGINLEIGYGGGAFVRTGLAYWIF